MFTAYNGHCSLIKFKGTVSNCKKLQCLVVLCQRSTLIFQMKPDDWIMLALNRQIESSIYIPTDDTGQIQMHFKSLNTDGTTIDIGQDAVLAVIDLYIEEFMDQVDSVCSKSVEYMKSGKRNFKISQPKNKSFDIWSCFQNAYCQKRIHLVPKMVHLDFLYQSAIYHGNCHWTRT